MTAAEDEQSPHETLFEDPSCHQPYLAGVDDVNQPVALLLNNTVADTREVGGIVGKS